MLEKQIFEEKILSKIIKNYFKNTFINSKF